MRARLVNTDQLPQRFTVSGAPFRVVAIDASDVETGELDDVAIEIPAGGRYDVEFTMRRDPVAMRAEASDDRRHGLRAVTCRATAALPCRPRPSIRSPR